MYFRLTPLFLLLFACSLPAQAKMYKWVDDEGRVHFADTLPTDYLNKERKELNSQGATVRIHPAAETEAQRKERFKAEREDREKRKKRQAQAKQDKVLLDTYTTERDLTAARDARLDAVGSQLQLSESIIEATERKLDQTGKQITRIKAGGKAVPQNILDKMKSEERQLKTHREVAAGHEKRKQKISDQFASYIKRFRELKAERQRVKDEREARRREALGLE